MNKEQIKIQIENLKAELEALERELNKPEKFEFIYNKNTTYSISSYQIMGEKNGIDEDYLSNFRYRQLEINAKEDFQLQKELMCIGALAEQIDPDYKSKINFTDDYHKYTIFYDYARKTYVIGSNREWKCLGVVYMPSDVAKKVCEILNNKEVEL